MSEPRKNVRGTLRRTADNADEAIAQTLMDALSAEKDQTVSVVCKHCGRESRPTVTVRDHGNAIRAAEKLVELGYGRAASDSETAQGCAACSEVKEMSDEDVERGMVEWLTQRGYSVNAPGV